MRIIKNYFGTLFKKSGLTNTFGEIFPSLSDFTTGYANSHFPAVVGDSSLSLIYYLLYAKYKNNNIKGDDQDQFKMRVFSIIFQHAPEFEKRLEIRDKINSIDLSNDAWMQGTTQVFNNAQHPSNSPGTLSMEEIGQIDARSTTLTKKGIMESYMMLSSLIERDVTQEFIDKFKVLFSDIVTTSTVLLYDVPEEDDND